MTKAETKELRNYDPRTTGAIDEVLLGKKGLTDDIFDVFNYLIMENIDQNKILFLNPEAYNEQGIFNNEMLFLLGHWKFLAGYWIFFSPQDGDTKREPCIRTYP